MFRRCGGAMKVRWRQLGIFLAFGCLFTVLAGLACHLIGLLCPYRAFISVWMKASKRRRLISIWFLRHAGFFCFVNRPRWMVKMGLSTWKVHPASVISYTFIWTGRGVKLMAEIAVEKQNLLGCFAWSRSRWTARREAVCYLDSRKTVRKRTRN